MKKIFQVSDIKTENMVTTFLGTWIDQTEDGTNTVTSYQTFTVGEVPLNEATVAAYVNQITAHVDGVPETEVTFPENPVLAPEVTPKTM